jgi:hypothetical protein
MTAGGERWPVMGVALYDDGRIEVTAAGEVVVTASFAEISVAPFLLQPVLLQIVAVEDDAVASLNALATNIAQITAVEAPAVAVLNAYTANIAQITATEAAAVAVMNAVTGVTAQITAVEAPAVAAMNAVSDAVAGGSNWFDVVAAQSDVVMQRRFDSQVAIDARSWGGADPLITLVQAGHADIAAARTRLLNFMPGSMRVEIPPQVSSPSAGNDNSAQWTHKLREDWPNWYDGYGPGDSFCLQAAMYINAFFAEARWLHVQGSGGNKQLIISLWNEAHPGNLQFFQGNGSYHDFFQYSWDVGGSSTGLGDSLTSACRSGDTIYQSAVDHETRFTHPLGLDVNNAALTACDRLRMQRGGLNSWTRRDRPADPPYYDPALPEPQGSDQRSGAAMIRRDAKDKWAVFNYAFTISSAWGVPDGSIEVMVSIEGAPFRRLLDLHSVAFLGATGSIGGSANPTTAYSQPTGTKNPSTYLPDGRWRWNGTWPLVQNSSRDTYSNQSDPAPGRDTPVFMYYGWLQNREQGRMLPRPWGLLAPLSRRLPAYIAPYVVGQGPQARLITSVSGPHPTIHTTMPALWQGAAPYDDDIMYVFGGGCWDEESGTYMIMNGGHSDTYCNAFLSFHYHGKTLPEGWRLQDATTVQADVVFGTEFYNDGRISARHMYSGTAYVPEGPIGTGDRTFFWGGSGVNTGGGRSQLISYNWLTKAWTAHGAPHTGTQGLGNILLYDRLHKVLLCYDPSAGRYRVFDVITNTFLSASHYTTSSINGTGQNTGIFCYIGEEVRFIVLGAANSVINGVASNRRIWRFDGVRLRDPANANDATNTGQSGVLTGTNLLTGDLTPQITRSPAICWDRDNNRIWAMLLTSDASRQQLWEGEFTSAQNINWQVHTIGGDSLAASASDRPSDSFMKLGYLRRLGALGLVRSRSGQMATITLPAQYRPTVATRFKT